jgi:TnpA family transposase
VSPEAIGATVAFLLQICMVYVNTLLVQKGLSEK